MEHLSPWERLLAIALGAGLLALAVLGLVIAVLVLLWAAGLIERSPFYLAN